MNKTLFNFAVAGMKAQAEVNKLCQQPVAHRDDPMTSYDAGQKMIDSGRLQKQERLVYHYIKLYIRNTGHRNFTAKEVSEWGEISYYTVQRRLSGLRQKGKIVRQKGKIERTSQKRNGCCVWRLK